MIDVPRTAAQRSRTYARPGARGVGALVAALLASPHGAAAQDDAAQRKQALAVRVEAGSINFDGRLDDVAWRDATPITDFVQAEPIEGAEPTDRMEVRFVYDDSALWIGARMHSAPGVPIQAPMTQRDEGGQAEYLQIELDTYLDRRTAYMFGVTASGVRLDHYHASDNERDSDQAFNPVWEAKTTFDDEGWTAELWLPFSQLRFTSQVERVWGLNVKRFRPSLNEEVYWVVVRRTERGWASRFGDLRGILDVAPRQRLEIAPYLAATSTLQGTPDALNPCNDGFTAGQRVGADLKVGVGPNLTLEATVNPDFGQIEADPAEVNLSAFETFFGERRPFFYEGGHLLEGPSNNYFYSRRIGARPAGSASGDYVDYPETTTILGAAKLTGRLPSGLSIGALGAVTAEEHARTSTGGLFDRARVAPRTYWGVTRLEQEIGTQGSTAGIQLAGVHRDLADSDPLAAILAQNVITGVADTQLNFANRTYEARMSVGFSYVKGQPAAIERIQRANTHLFQRPDRDVVRLDPSRDSLGGLQIRGNFDKVAGRHWLWGGNVMIESPEFETNDIGRLTFAGDVQANARLRYRETQPGRWFRGYSVQVSTNSTSYYQADLGARVNVGSGVDLTLNNFWFLGFDYNVNFRGQDAQQTRGGPSMGTPKGWNARVFMRNSGSSTRRWNAGMFYRENENGDVRRGLDARLSVRPTPAWQLSVSPDYSTEVSTRQYVTALDGGRAATFGRRYIFGAIDRSTLSMQLRASYIFKPDLTLEAYAEPFAASGRYTGFGELLESRSRRLRAYGEEGTVLARQPDGSVEITDGAQRFTLSNRDFNVRSFRSNVVLRWEWRPGSLLYMVWQQNRRSSDPGGDHVGPGDLLGSFSAPGDNVFAIKTTFWLAR
jgi:hypothetical protein